MSIARAEPLPRTAGTDGAESAVSPGDFRDGSSGVGKPITSRGELEAVAGELSGSFELGADIDLSGAPWTPLGDAGAPFTGSLLGRGFKITGLTINDASLDNAGLFGVVSNATLDGIALEGVSVAGKSCVGALAGDVRGATAVRGCTAGGAVRAANSYAGMMAGRVCGSGTSFEGCTASGTVESASTDTGGFVGSVYSAPASFADCEAGVAVSGSGGNNKGGFAGSVRDGDAAAAFARCAAAGAVTAPNSSYAGGFVGYANKASSFLACKAGGGVSGRGQTGGFVGGTASAASEFKSCEASGRVDAGGSQAGGFVGQAGAAGGAFADCLALGDVLSTASDVGGFAGTVSSSNGFANCAARGSVGGTGSLGGFAGSAGGAGSRFADCSAAGGARGRNSSLGGFVGQSTAAGIRYEGCSALGGVATRAQYAGGFAGSVSASNEFLRCMAAGVAMGASEAGGFAGYVSGAGSAFAECFALGDASALRDGIAGGFAGDVYNAASFTDCYSLGSAGGRQTVGGFAGRCRVAGIGFSRCYAAGRVSCDGAWGGSFAGNGGSATAADCASALPLHAFGTGTTGESSSREGIAELDPAGFRDSANFGAFLDPDPTPWMQVDGVTQPVLRWSAENGFCVYPSVGGSATGRVSGDGCHEPGETVEIRAESEEGFFVEWSGSTPYADPSSAATTIALDNHRVAAVVFGQYVRTAAELQAVTNDPGGIYGLANDIDLAGVAWTPIGTSSMRFGGRLYGLGHSISNLSCTRNQSVQGRGLFGWTSGAILDGLSVSGEVVSTGMYAGGLVGYAESTLVTNCAVAVDVTAGGYYAGGIVGCLGNGSAVFDSKASGRVSSTSQRVGGIAGGDADGTFRIERCVAAGETSGASNVGGVIGHVSSRGGMPAIAGCRADGFTSGGGNVGGFAGNVNAPLAIVDCAARGDVRSTDSGYGGFVGRLYHSDALVSNCWSSGSVWGTGGNVGSFVGQHVYGTVSGCAVSAAANGIRPFCGNSASVTGGRLSGAEVKARSRDWDAPLDHSFSATEIATAEDLLAVANNLAGNYVLVADIDLGGAEWTPVGGGSTPFTGEFYGRNHAIRNFKVESATQSAGLFGRIDGGRVSGVRAFGTVTGAGGGAGGFAGGISSRSLVDNCSFEGDVSDSGAGLGGFAGTIGDSPVVVRCSARGNVTQTGDADCAGGFAGEFSGGCVSDSYALAAVSAPGSRGVGGFAGSSSASAAVADAYCSGDVAGASDVGAFIGAENGATVSGCHCDKSGADAGSATPLTRDEMLLAGSFPDFDFAETWGIDEGETSPWLQKGVQTVVFDPNGGSCAAKSSAYAIGSPYGELPVPEWRDHGFLGWFTAAEAGEEVTAGSIVDEATVRTLFARWSELPGFTVVWENDDGTVLQSTFVPCGETPVYTGATPTKPPSGPYIHVFEGWTPDIVPVTGPATYTAVYRTVSAYDAWAAANGLGPADEVTDGVPNLIRYAFDVPSGPLRPITGIAFDDAGRTVVSTLELKNPVGVRATAQAVSDVMDWGAPAKEPLPAHATAVIFDDEGASRRFFRLAVGAE